VSLLTHTDEQNMVIWQASILAFEQVRLSNLVPRLVCNRPFTLGGIFRAERNFLLSCDFSGGTN
jgi:hypothetical protein